jgi:hypothetical protein
MRQEGLRQFNSNEFGKIMLIKQFKEFYKVFDVANSSVEDHNGKDVRDPVFIMPQSIRYLRSGDPFTIREGTLVYETLMGSKNLGIVRGIKDGLYEISEESQSYKVMLKLDQIEDALRDDKTLTESIKIIQTNEIRFNDFLDAFSMHVTHTNDTLGREYYDPELLKGLFSQEKISTTVSGKKDELSSTLFAIETIDEMYTSIKVFNEDKKLLRVFDFLNESDDNVITFNKNNLFEYMKHFNYIGKEKAANIESTGEEKLLAVRDETELREIPLRLMSADKTVIAKLVQEGAIPKIYGDPGYKFEGIPLDQLKDLDKKVKEKTIIMKAEVEEKKRKEKEVLIQSLKDLTAIKLKLIETKGAPEKVDDLSSADINQLQKWLTEAKSGEKERQSILVEIKSLVKSRNVNMATIKDKNLPDLRTYLKQVKGKIEIMKILDAVPLENKQIIGDYDFNNNTLEELTKLKENYVSKKEIIDFLDGFGDNLNWFMKNEISMYKTQNLEELKKTKANVDKKFELFEKLIKDNDYLLLKKYSNHDDLVNSTISELNKDLQDALKIKADRKAAKEQLEREKRQIKETYDRLVKEAKNISDNVELQEKQSQITLAKRKQAELAEASAAAEAEQKQKEVAAENANKASPASQSWANYISRGYFSGGSNANKSRRLIGRKLITAKKPKVKTGTVRKHHLPCRNKTLRNNNIFRF